MLSPERDNRAVSESERKITLNAVNREPTVKVALHVQGSFEKGSGR
jgi:hypothetical protein